MAKHAVATRKKKSAPSGRASEEGAIFDWLTLPKRFVGNDEGWVTGMECVRMELGEPDESGRRSPIPIEGSESTMGSTWS